MEVCQFSCGHNTAPMPLGEALHDRTMWFRWVIVYEKGLCLHGEYSGQSEKLHSIVGPNATSSSCREGRRVG